MSLTGAFSTIAFYLKLNIFPKTDGGSILHEKT